MHFRINLAIAKAFSDVKIGLLVAKNVNNRTSSLEIEQAMRQVEREARAIYKLEEIGMMPKILDWRAAYQKFGSKPSLFKSSVEALLRRVLQDKDLPHISPLVDAYNLVSIKYVIPAGANDLDCTEGGIALTFAQGGESFESLNAKQGEKESIAQGEVVYRDDKDVICRRWNYRESNKTKIREETKNACFVFEGLHHTSEEEIRQALLDLRILLERSCGGEYKELYLDAHHLEAALIHKQPEKSGI